MTILYIPNPTQYLNLTTTLLTINKQQFVFAKFLQKKFEANYVVNKLLIARIGL